MNRLLILVFSVLLLTTQGFSQAAKQFSFRHFTVSNGLVSNTVKDIVQDGDGYMWLVTMNGLQRYDGYAFITFQSKANSRHGLPNTSHAGLFVDRKKRLWFWNNQYEVGTFDTKRFQYRGATIRSNQKFVSFFWLFELPTGELMLRADTSLYQYDEARHEFVPSYGKFVLPAGWGFRETVWDANRKKYWIICDSGLVQFDPATRSILHRGHNPLNDPIIKAFATQTNPVGLNLDPQGNPLFVVWPPRSGNPFIHRFDPATLTDLNVKLSSLVGYHEIMGFLKQRNGRFWVHGRAFMLQWTNNAKEPFIPLTGVNPEASSIHFDDAYRAYEDREQNVWLATDNGIFLFNPDAQIFNTFNLQRVNEPQQERFVQALAELPDGRILIGTWGGGLYCYDQQFNPLPLPKALAANKTLSVWDMAFNKHTGDLWITQQAGGITVFNVKTERAVELYPEVFKKSTIRQIDEDTSGNLWFGQHNGQVIRWDLKKSGGDPSKGYELVTKTGLVRKVHFDYSGYMWVGTENHGLLKIDARTGKIVKEFRKDGPEGQRLFSDVVMDMTYYNDTTLIVVTDCINILNTKRNTISWITADDGLPSNTVISVEKDANGIIWAGMVNGISRVNLPKRLISYYDRRNGMAYDKFSHTGVNELDDGRLVFYTDHNFLLFDPKQFGQNSRPLTPAITSLRLGNQWLSPDSIQKAGGTVYLDFSNTSIGISFSALSYLIQPRQHFYYRMVGLDKEWIRTDRPLEATYNYLANGTYTFEVKSENADGITNGEVARLHIVVKPPFYKTWWFWGLIILLFGIVAYVIDRERQQRLKSVKLMRRQIAGNLHTEVNNTLNNINVLSEIAKIKADKNIEQSKEFIDQISAKSRYMIEAMDDMLWSIDPQNDSMKKTLLRIREFTDGLRADSEVDIDLIVDNKVQSLELDMKLRHELFFFYKEALQFLLLNTTCTQVFVNINQVRSKLMLEILTECSKVNDELVVKFKKTLKKRADLLGAQMDVMSDSRSFSVMLFVDL